MIWAGMIQDLAYDNRGQKLFVLFDSQRRVLFHHVPPDLWERLSDGTTRDQILARDVIGQFAWSELGSSVDLLATSV
jgi:hypothetical protein